MHLSLLSDYPYQALVAVSTHDLPTLYGFWEGNDLDARAAIAPFPFKGTVQQASR